MRSKSVFTLYFQRPTNNLRDSVPTSLFPIPTPIATRSSKSYHNNNKLSSQTSTFSFLISPQRHIKTDSESNQLFLNEFINRRPAKAVATWYCPTYTIPNCDKCYNVLIYVVTFDPSDIHHNGIETFNLTNTDVH